MIAGLFHGLHFKDKEQLNFFLNKMKKIARRYWGLSAILLKNR
jgi:hypothetical protein